MLNKFILASVLLLASSCQLRSEITLCRDSPAAGKWIYRIIEGHKCWFEADGLRRGRERPREQLLWPKYNGDFEGRWRGAKDGWEHRE